MKQANAAAHTMIALMNLFQEAAPREFAKVLEKTWGIKPQHKPGRPLQWTPEWRAALFIFVERQVHLAVLRDLLENNSVTTKSCQAYRKEAFKESLSRRFPFRKPTLDAAKAQHSKAKKQLNAENSLNWIHTALGLEAMYSLVSHMGSDQARNWIIAMDPDNRALPDWIWEKLAIDGRLLMPDIPVN